MRGFLGGVSMGALVAAAGAAMLSLSAPLPKTVDVAVLMPTETLEPMDATRLPVETPGPDADLVEAAPAAPTSEVGDDLSALQDVDTQPAARPVIGSGEAILTDPAAALVAPASAPDIAIQTDAPVIPVEALPAPLAPSPEAEIVVSSEPAQPPQPIAVPQLPEVETGAPAPEITAMAASGSATIPPSERGPDIEPNPVLGVAPVAPQVAESATVAAPNVGVEVPVMRAPVTSTAPFTSLPSVVEAPAAQLVPGESREDVIDITADATTPDQATERVAALPTTAGSQDGSDGPTIGTPVVPLTERNKGEDADILGDPRASSPFEMYAEPFDNFENRPLMAIVLIDDALSIGAEALVGFPYPLSFAIDPEDPRAADKMAAHRAAGFEVLVLTDLPREAAPQDAETALAVWFKTLPETIAVLEGTGTGFQGNRPLADQVSAVAAASGRGMLTQDHGLNTVQKLAARDGVPAAVVFRDFDGAGQNPKAIRRFLDQAAFRAGQEGAVIMLGRVRPDTISALLLWGLQDRASRVALAPVSAALSFQASGQ